MSHYQNVAAYYDAEAAEYESRYWQNPILQRMRQAFRSELMRYPFSTALEIGFGNGLDLQHIREVRDNVGLHGLEVSEGMLQTAAIKLGNDATLKIGHPEQLDDHFPDQKFDVIYVFFGALNSCENLNETANQLEKALNPGGRLILTFVNKWYVFGMLAKLAKLRFREAFARLGSSWYGYSADKSVKGKCYTPWEIQNAFGNLMLERHKGYCIIHPAWYMTNFARSIRPALRYLWKVDRILNHTPARDWGEYSLFVFKKP